MIYNIQECLEDLTGKKGTKLVSADISVINPFNDGDGVGYNQMNELLLLFGYRRISHSFFQFLVDGTLEFKISSKIKSLQHFKDGIQNFQRLALLFFGSINNAYNILSRDEVKLKYYLFQTQERALDSYLVRQHAILPIDPIPADETYYLGHLIQDEIKEKLRGNPDDPVAQREYKKMQEITLKGIRNHEAYLTSDHLDLYIATSMRLKHEYLFINRITNLIFQNNDIEKFNLRWFDPTQAFCTDRIDKGLSEALMLKRAKCTIYLAQESDTLGKDSELATTLAQGKPVIVYIPEIDKDYINNLISDNQKVEPGKDEESILIDLLKNVNPNLAWENEELRNWLNDRNKIDKKELKKLFASNLEYHYNKRAKLFKERHPLGIQVNLTTGVATGLLVVRKIEDCVKLIVAILRRKLDFDLITQQNGNKKDIFLKEKISDCIFRIVTGDLLLTNSFWNFYLETNPDELLETETIA